MLDGYSLRCAMKKEHFCTCRDRECPHNPNNPDTCVCSCDDCVAKNLARGEIPSCFFRLVNDDLSSLSEFTVERFVRFWIENKGKAK